MTPCLLSKRRKMTARASSARETSFEDITDAASIVLRSGKGSTSVLALGAHTSAARTCAGRQLSIFAPRLPAPSRSALDSSKPPLGFPSDSRQIPGTLSDRRQCGDVVPHVGDRDLPRARPSLSPTISGASRGRVPGRARSVEQPRRRAAPRAGDPASRAARLARTRSPMGRDFLTENGPDGTPWTAWGAWRWTSSSTSTRHLRVPLGEVHRARTPSRKPRARSGRTPKGTGRSDSTKPPRVLFFTVGNLDKARRRASSATSTARVRSRVSWRGMTCSSLTLPSGPPGPAPWSRSAFSPVRVGTACRRGSRCPTASRA